MTLEERVEELIDDFGIAYIGDERKPNPLTALRDKTVALIESEKQESYEEGWKDFAKTLLNEVKSDD